jgi:protein TonB
MYADPSRRRSFSPVSFGAALAVNTAILGALMFAAPQVLSLDPEAGRTKIFDVPIPPPPEPVPDKPKPETKQQEVRQTLPYTPDPIFQIDQTPIKMTTTSELPLEAPPLDLGTKAGIAEVKVEVPPPLPFVSANMDPRYMRDFQPEYPASEIRHQREGKVTVRVRIGTDGRVTAVEQVSATSEAFFDATRRHALSRWRFKPATRGGKPEESWKKMNVTFVLTGDE